VTAAPLVIGCGTDARFAMPLAVTLRSALERLRPGREVHVYVVDGGIAPADADRLRRVLAGVPGAAPRVTLVPAAEAGLATLRTGAHFSAANYFRLLLPEVVPAHLHRVLYLDADLLVRADLAPLWEAEMGGAPLLAARDYSAPVVGAPYGLPNHAALGLAADTPYLNSGVLLMDLRRWREEEIARRVLEYTRRHADLVRYADQDGINAVLAGTWGELDPRWNVPVYVGSDALFAAEEGAPHGEAHRAARHRLLREAYVWHFVGGRKPWERGCGLPGQPAWLRALSRSGWYAPHEVLPRLRRWALRADWASRQLLRRLR
jgi:lipopolysaccharide biosynthesis glycosyltransferase